MFCTNCGRELPKDGTPCICGSGQREPAAQAPAVEEWAVEIPVLNEEPAAAEQPTEPQPEPEEQAGETTVLHSEPQPEEWHSAPQSPYIQQPTYQQPVYNQAPVYQQPVYAAPAYAIQGGNAVTETIRRIAGSPLFLIAAIVMSVHLLLSVVKAFVPIDFYGIVYNIIPILDSIMPGMGQELLYGLDEAMAQLYATQATIGVLSLPALIAPALTVAALWMIFASAKKPGGPKTGGLTILQVLQILSIIGIALGVLAAIFVVIIICVAIMALIEQLSAYGMYGGEDIGSIVIGVAAVVIAAILASVILSLIYAIKVLTSIVNAKKAIRTGVVVKTASKFVVFYNFASAVILVLDLYGTVAMMGWASALVNLCAAVANVLFAVCILKYNKAVKPLIGAQNPVPQMQQPPVYPQY